MLRNKGRWIASMALLVFVAASCANEKDRDQAAVEKAIAEEVNKRLAEFQKVRMDMCREETYKEAGRRADSILIARARLEKDSFQKPPKPIKPEKPAIKLLDDTLSLKPII
ncbi:MAG TPA: hypothetical protein PKA00_19860 [Saprospiraceae bacterium]|nr:hypothetical protein [Saprospiraceae bacterium]HMQ85176.1 hypothetical protein [Saprospiraceae bacterium]